jgi:hypothetical protein
LLINKKVQYIEPFVWRLFQAMACTLSECPSRAVMPKGGLPGESLAATSNWEALPLDVQRTFG